MTAEQLYKKSEDILKNLLIKSLPSDSQIFLFGSRAKNNFSTSSDIDIGIIASQIDSKVLINLKDRIEESFVPYHIDLIDFTKVSPEFKKKAMENIVRWN